MSETVRIASEGETLLGDLYGVLPSRRAAILVHGQQWDASGWREVAERFVSRGVTALALNLRGYDGSSGKTNKYAPPKPWSPVADLRAAKALLRERGASEIALVGASMGGHAISPRASRPTSSASSRCPRPSRRSRMSYRGASAGGSCSSVPTTTRSVPHRTSCTASMSCRSRNAAHVRRQPALARDVQSPVRRGSGAGHRRLRGARI